MNDQLRSFLWLVVAVIFLGAMLIEPPTDNPTPQPAPTPTATPSPSPGVENDILGKEKVIVQILLSPEQRKQFCTKRAKIGIAQNGDLLLIECEVVVEGKTFTLHYTPIGQVFTIIDPKGSVMGDNEFDGDINFAETNKEEKTFTNFKNFSPSGLEFKAEWQTLFEKYVQTIFLETQKNPIATNDRIFYLYG